MARRGFFLTLLAVASLLGSSGAFQEPSQSAPSASAEAQACASQGGVLEARGKGQHLYCIKPSPDAGKACSNTSDCTGRCLFDPTSASTNAYQASVERCEKLCGGDKDHQCAMHCFFDPKGAPKLVGRCQPDQGPIFGCFAEVDGGKLKGGMCVD